MADIPEKVPSPNGQGDLTLENIKEAAREFGHKVVPERMIVSDPQESDPRGEAIHRALGAIALRPF